jgi:hypothetical protein
MHDIAAAMNAPKQIIKDANGEPIGVAPMQQQPPMGAPGV